MRRMLLLGGLLALPALLWAKHGHWIDHYRGAGGMAAHMRFGARTGGALVMLGSAVGWALLPTRPPRRA